MERSVETRHYEWLILGFSCPPKFVNRWLGTGRKISEAVCQECAAVEIGCARNVPGIGWFGAGQALQVIDS